MTAPERDHDEVDAALASWRQGDCVLGEHWFLARAVPGGGLTEASAQGCDPKTGNYEAAVVGLAVLTQTCDLLRRCADRPFVEVAPIVALDASGWTAASRGRVPRFAVLPALSSARLAADLDRVMTVEKPVVAAWERVGGWTTDAEARFFAASLARKRARVAFPDDFVALVRPLQGRIVERHEKQSQEGRALRALREIRVRAAPSWDAPEVEVEFLFIRDADTVDFDGVPWHQQLEAWLKLVPASGRFEQVDGLVQTLDDLTARDYVESDPLDLGFLSDRAA